MDCFRNRPHRIGGILSLPSIPSLGKTFFVDMLSNGIPVKRSLSMLELFEKLEVVSNDLETFSVDFFNGSIIVVDEYGTPTVAIKKEQSDKADKLFLFTQDEDSTMDNATIIGHVLFITVTTCAQMDALLLNPVADPKRPTSESFDFESDFI